MIKILNRLKRFFTHEDDLERHIILVTVNDKVYVWIVSTAVLRD